MNVYKQQETAVCASLLGNTCFLNKISRNAEQHSQSKPVLRIKSRLVIRLTTSTTPHLQRRKSVANTDQY